MPNREDSGIVADGARRLAKAKNLGKMRQRLRAESLLRHAAEREGASLWRRIWIGVKIRREVRAELAKQFSPTALYLGARTIFPGIPEGDLNTKKPLAENFRPRALE